MGFFHPFRNLRRKALAKEPFPEAWSAIMLRNVPYCLGLHADERTRLEELIKVLIAEKNFEGCAGIEITDEIKVTIAAQACLLLLNIRHNFYEGLVTILVYPQNFVFEREERNETGLVTVTKQPVLGLCSSTGTVVVSWPDTLHGAQWPDDGRNVVLHEFAHQLDQLDGSMNGAPVLDSAFRYREWAQVLGAEYEHLKSEVALGRPSLIGDYAATKPAEFFAVVTELFFERPFELQQQHPALYGAFQQYYQQDPAARVLERSAHR